MHAHKVLSNETLKFTGLEIQSVCMGSMIVLYVQGECLSQIWLECHYKLHGLQVSQIF